VSDKGTQNKDGQGEQEQGTPAVVGFSLFHGIPFKALRLFKRGENLQTVAASQAVW
jgi:hypothetical protein